MTYRPFVWFIISRTMSSPRSNGTKPVVLRGPSAALAAAAALFFAAPSHPQTDETPVNGIIPYPTVDATLDNGLKVIVMPMPSDGLVAFWSIVRTGSRDEYEPGRSGFAHFFEHMMFRGTERYPAEVYQRILTELGADANAYTTDDLTAYHVSMTSADLERVMELESDRFMNLAYSEAGFETEAGAVYGEYRKGKTDPLFVLYETMRSTAFERHTYGHTTMGYEQDIVAMPTMYAYSRTFFARYYRPENTILFVAGDVDAAAVHALAEKYYGDWQRGYVTPEVLAEPPQQGERRFDLGYDGRTLPLLWVAYKIDAFDPSNRVRVAADLLAELAFGETSDAYQRLVLEEQVVEFLQGDPNLNRDPTLLDIYTRIKDPARVDYVLAAIDATTTEYREALVDADRLAALKSRLRYGFLMGLETPDQVAQRLARHIAISGGLEDIGRLYTAYADVTAEDVRDAARAYFVTGERTVGVLRSAQ
jgi:zinc protease